MGKATVFVYSYSGAANSEVLAIRKKYLREESKIDELKRLDREVQEAGTHPRSGGQHDSRSDHRCCRHASCDSELSDIQVYPQFPQEVCKPDTRAQREAGE